MESSRISDGNMMIMSGNGVLDSYIIELLKQEFEIVVVDTMAYATLLICNLETTSRTMSSFVSPIN
jgi:hypothetical protein